MIKTCPVCNSQVEENALSCHCGYIFESIQTIDPVIEPPHFKLWNPASFIVISFICSFLPASIMYAINYGRLGYSRKRLLTLILAPLIFISALTIGFVIEGSSIKTIFYVLNLGLGIFMYNDQKRIYLQHIQSGGKKASYVIPVIGCIVFSSIFIGIFIYTINIPHDYKVFQGDELYYTKRVSIEDVDKLGNYLVENGLFVKDGKTISFKIDKSSGTYVMSIVVDKAYLEDADTIVFFSVLKSDIAKNVFNDNKVQINMCDNRFNKLKGITD